MISDDNVLKSNVSTRVNLLEISEVYDESSTEKLCPSRQHLSISVHFFREFIFSPVLERAYIFIN